MRIIKFIFLALILGIFAAGAGLAQEAKTQTVCPVLGGNVDKKVFVDYQGKRIYFCCQGCDATFKQNPEKFMKEAQEKGITFEKCPEPQK